MLINRLENLATPLLTRELWFVCVGFAIRGSDTFAK